MKRALVLLLVGTLAEAKGRPLRPKPGQRVRAVQLTPAAAANGPAQVTSLTATATFINRGAIDGVKVGAVLPVNRAGRLAGACTVTVVSDRWASCTGTGFRVGDRLSIDRASGAGQPKPATPLPDAAELEVQRVALEDQAVPLVDSGAGGSLGGSGPVRFEVAISHTTWANVASPGGPFQLQRVDVGVRDVELWRGLKVAADLSVLNWSRRPAVFQSPETGTPQLHVRQLELSWSSPDVPFVARVGRTWTRYTPGLWVIDGAQAGYAALDGSLAAGVYGGLLPEPISFGIALNRWAAGAYLMARLQGGASLWQVEARAGFASRALSGGRLEAGVAAHGWLGKRTDLHLGVDVGAGAVMAPAAIDGAHADLGVRPLDRLRLSAAVRYRAQPSLDALEYAVAPPGSRVLFADAGARLELSDFFWLGVQGGAALGLDAVAGPQARVGPELQLPRLFGSVGGLSLGFQEELGTFRGRSGYLQVGLSPIARVRVLTRLSWFQEAPTALAPGLEAQDLGASLAIDVRFTRWLWLRLSGLGRTQVAGLGSGGDSSAGATAVAAPARLGGTGTVQLGAEL